jgi:hypothetical protein
VFQKKEFLGIAGRWVVRMKPARHKSIDTLDGCRFGSRADLEEFIMVDVAAARNRH